jgi:hypothetical protein
MRGYDKWKTEPPPEEPDCTGCSGKGTILVTVGLDTETDDCPTCDGGRATPEDVEFSRYVEASEVREEDGYNPGRYMFSDERFHPAVDAQFFADIAEWR